MKKIIYTRPDGGLSVMTPAAGARLATKVISAFGVTLYSSSEPIAVEQISRTWKILFETTWAETEDAFTERIAFGDVPVILNEPWIDEDGYAHDTVPRKHAIKLGLAFEAIPYCIVDATDVPTDRTYRNAWMDTGTGTVTHDMTKAREIHKNKLRELRAPKMAALDVEYFRAEEAGDTVKKALIASKKQALRDVTADPGIAAAQTVDELKLVIPTILTGV